MLLAVVAAVVVVEVAMAVEVAAVAVLAVVDDATAFEGSQHTDSFLPLSTPSCPLPPHCTLPTYPPTCIPTQPTLAMMLVAVFLFLVQFFFNARVVIQELLDFVVGHCG